MKTAYLEVREKLQKAAERKKHEYDLRVKAAIFKEGIKCGTSLPNVIRDTA